MMIPTVVATGGFINLAYKFDLINKLSLLILPAIATPISVVFMRLYLESTLSRALLDSARIDGAGEFRIFNQIVLPILKPAIATQAIFAFVASWNDASTPSVVLIKDESKTLPLVTALNLAMGDYLLTAFVILIGVPAIHSVRIYSMSSFSIVRELNDSAVLVNITEICNHVVHIINLL
jgi:multiple sugar transport system permease protein